MRSIRLPRSACLALLCCLGLHVLPAQALMLCPKSVSATTGGEAQPETAAVARRLAGLKGPGASAAFDAYAIAADGGWQASLKDFGQPLRGWASREIRQEPGRTVFYPFSGPDLPSVLSLYPAAARYVMISDQFGNRHFDPLALAEPEQGRVLTDMGDAWGRFGSRGFFVTQELNKGGERKYHWNTTMTLMAFAVRLGYEVRSVRPVCLDAAELSIRPLDGNETNWASVRLELRKEGRDVVVDYLQQDLSNRGLRKHTETRKLIDALAKGPVLFKAASHLPQMPAFSILRDIVLANAPLVVQDETGIEYDELAKRFDVRLYGDYVGAHRLFKEAVNTSLMRAYKERAPEVRPLGFRLGYEKEAGSAIQVATRK